MLILAINQLAKRKTALRINGVPSKPQRCVWLKISALVLLFCPLTSLAQTYDLKPENWLPLEVGSTWHYKIEIPDGDTNDLIQKAIRDSFIEGQK